MNLLGKILTAIILILSLVFMTAALFVGATQKNWKQQAKEMEAETKRVEQLNEQLETVKARLQKSLARSQVSRVSELAQLNSRLNELQTTVRTQEELLNNEKRAATTALAQVETLSNRVEELDGNIADLEAENTRLTTAISDTMEEIIATRNQNFGLQGSLVNETEKAESLEKLVAKSARAMATAGIDLEAPTAHIAPMVDGEITEASKEFVVLSIGVDDGLRVGHELDVFRGTKFVGKVKITGMNKGNRAVAQVTLDRSRIQIGDSVTTKLNSRG